MSAVAALTPFDAAFSSLGGYIGLQWPRYQFGRHHRAIIAALESVERGDCKRLMIAMPPRHGKSMLVSEFFPAWFLGRNPDKSIIASSYAAELAEDFGRKVRNQCQSAEWLATFPGVQLDPSSQSSARFGVLHHGKPGGAYYAVGVGGATTGRGAHVLLIDDPIKDREQADSETIRRKIKDWYRSVAYTRLMPGGAVIIVMTRWHEDDLAGWCLEEQGHEGWQVLSLPALAEDGDALGRAKGAALWPDRYDAARLDEIRQTVGPREWQALYQQRPAPDEGAYFRREWLQTYEALPPYLRYYGASDYAVTADGGDYTVHVLAGVDESDNIYIVDLWRGQTDALEWIDAWAAMVGMYKPQIWAEEGGVILKSLDPIIRKRCAEGKIYSTYRQQFTSAADKPTRARSLQARMQMGKVFFPAPARCPWVADLFSEMLSFPVSRHDDQVDALSLLTRMLAEMQPARVPQPEKTLAERVQEAAATPWTAQDLFDGHFKKCRQRRAYA